MFIAVSRHCQLRAVAVFYRQLVQGISFIRRDRQLYRITRFGRGFINSYGSVDCILNVNMRILGGGQLCSNGLVPDLNTDSMLFCRVEIQRLQRRTVNGKDGTAGSDVYGVL